jgi:hypothetical protein
MSLSSAIYLNMEVIFFSGMLVIAYQNAERELHRVKNSNHIIHFIADIEVTTLFPI